MKRLKNNFNTPYYSIDTAVFFLRITSGFLMGRHGWAKLMQLLQGNFDFPDPLGISPLASLSATIFAELVCAVLVMVGLLTRPALAVLIFTMGVAAFVIHKLDPLDVKEHALLFLTIYLTIFITGSGRISLDRKLFYKN